VSSAGSKIPLAAGEAGDAANESTAERALPVQRSESAGEESGRCCGVGLKGAGRSATAGEVRTAGSNVTEDRSEPPEPSGQGLSRW